MNMWKWIFASLFICIFCLPPSAHSEDYLSKLHPYISLVQTYDDNINLVSTDKKGDFITTIQPGISFQNMNETGGLNLDYNIGQNWYWSESQNNYISQNGNLDAKYMTREHINFYLKDMFIRSEEPREQQYLVPSYITNAYQLSMQTERSIYTRNIVAPTVEYQFGKDDRIGLNYRNDTYNNQDPTIGKSQENYVNPYFSYWFDPQNGISGEYGFTRGDFQLSPNLEANMARLRYTNRPDQKATVYTEYFYEKRNFDAPYPDYDINEPRLGMTYNFSPTLTALIQVGYYWQKQQNGPGRNGPTYEASLTNLGKQTIYYIILQGGYYEDYFTSQNLGFARYHRILVSIKHNLERHIYVGLSGNLELADYESDRNDVIFGITGSAGYDILKWLSLSMEYTHQELNSNINTDEYVDNKVTLILKATY